MRLPRFLFVAFVACSNPITVDEGSTRQISWEARIDVHVPALVVVVVDDGPSPDAATLRALFTLDSVAPSLSKLLPPSSPVFDPASAIAPDVRVFVVHPSSATFVSPLDDPRLGGDVDTLATAITTHAAESIASANAPYSLLSSTRDVVSLLLHEREPMGAREIDVVSSLPQRWQTISVMIATSRDDDSPGGVGGYIPPAWEQWQTRYIVFEPCTGTTASKFPRLATWAKGHAETFAGYCGESWDHLPLVDVWGGGCPNVVPASAIARDATGAAECAITFDIPASASCDASRGWTDPLGRDGVRRPLFDDDVGLLQRRCEIAQLAGAARTSCESSLACPDCTPGMCITDAIGTHADGCPALARFVGGSLPQDTGSALLHFTCNLSSAYNGPR